jgi:hypothetical protein
LFLRVDNRPTAYLADVRQGQVLLSDIPGRAACLQSNGNHSKETIMTNQKDDIKRDDPDDKDKRTIRHETIPGERPAHPTNRTPGSNKESGGPGAARSTADEDTA